MSIKIARKISSRGKTYKKNVIMLTTGINRQNNISALKSTSPKQIEVH